MFALVSFPFLFGVMFGDIMHGTILFTFATYLCWGNFPPGHQFEMLHWARYLFLLMGLFSFYGGMIYNDFTSIPLNMWAKSCWSENETTKVMESAPNCVFPVGIDPAWFQSKNELVFFNSMKMKISVILGVVQMGFGVCLKASNSIYFKRYVEFAFEFIP